MKNAWEYLIASLINSEKDELAINTIFSIIQTKDVPEKYRALYQVIQEVWGNYGIIEPLTIADG
jgi:folylpolyglutamate synthase/dihydropteroate synthase